MSTFEAKVYKLTIEPHPNADKLELAVVGDYRSVVGKGQFLTGDYGVYIQEGSIVPDWLIEKLGLTGKLAGSQHNRVKAMKLRGIVSQGLIVPVTSLSSRNALVVGVEPKPTTFMGVENITPVSSAVVVTEGQDCAELLGITKYEPPIPVHMSGEVFNAFGFTINFDIENIKKFTDVFVEGEEVVMTEKLHGTWTCLGYHPNLPAYTVTKETPGVLTLQAVTSRDIVTSKGLSGNGLAFKFCDANKDNLYMRSLESTKDTTGQTVIDRGTTLFNLRPFYILGETYGKGVQDLTYGTTKPEFRVFDIYVGEPGQGQYLGYDDLIVSCKALDVQMVPIVYQGPFNKEILLEMTNGKTTGDCLKIGQSKSSVLDENTLREGVVIKPVIERRHDLIGRVCLKSISDAYLLRKGNVTELT